MSEKIFTVRLPDNCDAVEILDQTLLPNKIKYLRLKTAEELWEAIRSLRVRGAPAIGIAAGFGMYVVSKNFAGDEYNSFIKKLKDVKDYLNSSRPTAVNLSFAVNRMLKAAERAGNTKEALELLKNECVSIYEEDRAMCRAISENGLTLIKDGDGILTHCNAGALAASEYGTGLGALLLGKERGYNFKVFSDETRPLLQGARLTSF